MDKDTIDLERVVHDAEYRRSVIEKLKTKASGASTLPAANLEATEPVVRPPAS